MYDDNTGEAKSLLWIVRLHHGALHGTVLDLLHSIKFPERPLVGKAHKLFWIIPIEDPCIPYTPHYSMHSSEPPRKSCTCII